MTKIITVYRAHDNTLVVKLHRSIKNKLAKYEQHKIVSGLRRLLYEMGER